MFFTPSGGNDQNSTTCRINFISSPFGLLELMQRVICNPLRGRSSRLFAVLLLQLLFTVAVFLLYTRDVLISQKQKVIYIERNSRYYKYDNNTGTPSHRQNTVVPITKKPDKDVLYTRDVLISQKQKVIHIERNSRYYKYDNNTGTPSHRQNTVVPIAKKPEIDMVNDYHPYVDFRFEYPEIQPKINDSKDIYLVVLVNSGAKGNESRQRRAKIRETWASRKTCEYVNAMHDIRVKHLKWILVFVLGKAEKEENERNIEEAKKHNDMIIGDINDNYLNNILKFYMGQLWASLLGAKYTLKTDDDVYVRIPKVIEYLVSEGSPSRFYGGGTYRRSRVARWAGGKWSISKKYFPEDVFPPFNAGAFFVLSTDLLGGLINYVHIRKPFHTDDAYIGVAMRHLRVKVVHILSFVIESNMSRLVRTKDDCYILKVLAYGHGVRGEDMEHVNKRLENLCHGNVTLEALKCQV